MRFAAFLLAILGVIGFGYAEMIGNGFHELKLSDTSKATETWDVEIPTIGHPNDPLTIMIQTAPLGATSFRFPLMSLKLCWSQDCSTGAVIESSGAEYYRVFTPNKRAQAENGKLRLVAEFNLSSSLLKDVTFRVDEPLIEVFTFVGATAFSGQIIKGKELPAMDDPAHPYKNYMHYAVPVCSDEGDVSFDLDTLGAHHAYADLVVSTKPNPSADDILTTNTEWWNPDTQEFTIPAAELAKLHTPAMLFVGLGSKDPRESIPAGQAFVKLNTVTPVKYGALESIIDSEVSLYQGCERVFEFTAPSDFIGGRLHMFAVSSNPVMSDARLRYGVGDITKMAADWNDDFSMILTEPIGDGQKLYVSVAPAETMLWSSESTNNPLHSVAMPFQFMVSDHTDEIEVGARSSGNVVNKGASVSFGTDFGLVFAAHPQSSVNILSQARIVEGDTDTGIEFCVAPNVLTPQNCHVITGVEVLPAHVAGLTGPELVGSKQAVATHTVNQSEWFFHVTVPEKATCPATVDVLTGVQYVPHVGFGGRFENLDRIDPATNTYVYFRFDLQDIVPDNQDALDDFDFEVIMSTGIGLQPLEIFASQKHMMPDAVFNDYSAEGVGAATLHNAALALDFTKPLYVSARMAGMGILDVSAGLIDASTFELDDGGAYEYELDSTHNEILGYFEPDIDHEHNLETRRETAFCSVSVIPGEQICPNDSCTLTLFMSDTQAGLFTRPVARASLDFSDDDTWIFQEMLTPTYDNIYWGLRVTSGKEGTDMSVNFNLRCGTYSSHFLHADQTATMPDITLVPHEFPDSQDFLLPYLTRLPLSGNANWELDLDFKVAHEDGTPMGPRGDIRVAMCNGEIPVIPSEMNPDHCTEYVIPATETPASNAKGVISRRLQHIHDGAVAYGSSVYLAVFAVKRDWFNLHLEPKAGAVPDFTWTVREAADINVHSLNFGFASFPAGFTTTYYAGRMPAELTEEAETVAIHTTFRPEMLVGGQDFEMTICVRPGLGSVLKGQVPPSLHQPRGGNDVCITRRYPVDAHQNCGVMELAFPVLVDFPVGANTFYMSVEAGSREANNADYAPAGLWRTISARRFPDQFSRRYHLDSTLDPLTFFVPTPGMNGPNTDFALTVVPQMPDYWHDEFQFDEFYTPELDLWAARGFIPDGTSEAGDLSKEKIFSGHGTAVLEITKAELGQAYQDQLPWMVTLIPRKTHYNGLDVVVEGFLESDLVVHNTPTMVPTATTVLSSAVYVDRARLASSTEMTVATCVLDTTVELIAAPHMPYISSSNVSPTETYTVGIVGNAPLTFSLAGAPTGMFRDKAYSFITARPSSGAKYEIIYKPSKLFAHAPSGNIGFSILKDKSTARITVPAARSTVELEYTLYRRDLSGTNMASVCGVKMNPVLAPTYTRITDDVAEFHVPMSEIRRYGPFNAETDIAVVVSEPGVWSHSYAPHKAAPPHRFSDPMTIAITASASLVGVVAIAIGAFCLVRYLQTRQYIKGYALLDEDEESGSDSLAPAPAPAPAPMPAAVEDDI